MEELKQKANFQDFIRQMLAIYECAETLVVAEENTVRLAMLHGLLAHTFEMTRAALTLIASKQVIAAEVVARVALEHAVFAEWAHLHPEGLNGLSQKEIISYGKLYIGLKDGFDFPQEVADFYKTKMQKPKDVAPEINWVKNLFESFVDGESLYEIYRILSGPVHPGNLTGRQYREYLVDGGEITLRWHPQLADELPVLHTLAHSVAYASWVYEDLREGKPRLVEIEAIAALGGISVPLVLKPVANPMEES